MTRLDRYVIAIGACVALVAAAGLVGDGIKRGLNYAGPFVPESTSALPNRWAVQQTFDDGWMVFDSATGRFCAVTFGPGGAQPASKCTTAPT